MQSGYLEYLKEGYAGIYMFRAGMWWSQMVVQWAIHNPCTVYFIETETQLYLHLSNLRYNNCNADTKYFYMGLLVTYLGDSSLIKVY